MRYTIKAGVLAAVMAATGAQAKETVVWWDFLGGGDGVRMKKLIEDFNAAHADTIEIQATTLDWGTPFYSKVQTSAAVGEGPDVMTYHASRIPLAVSQGTLTELGCRECGRQAVRRSLRHAPDRSVLQQGPFGKVGPDRG
jgi:multiple sugar transport system substrate-binding protein